MRRVDGVIPDPPALSHGCLGSSCPGDRGILTCADARNRARTKQPNCGRECVVCAGGCQAGIVLQITKDANRLSANRGPDCNCAKARLVKTERAKARASDLAPVIAEIRADGATSLRSLLRAPMSGALQPARRLTVGGTSAGRHPNCWPSIMIWTAYTVSFHLPAAIPRFDEAKFSGDSGVAKNPRVINRINADQAAREYIPSSVVLVILPRQSRRSSAKDDGCREGNLGLGHFVPHVCLID